MVASRLTGRERDRVGEKTGLYPRLWYPCMEAGAVRVSGKHCRVRELVRPTRKTYDGTGKRSRCFVFFALFASGYEGKWFQSTSNRSLSSSPIRTRVFVTASFALLRHT